MRILTVVGARPQFIKAATVSREIRARDDIEEVIVHTGQHFDPSMSNVFFEQMNIPKPHHDLGVSGLSHGAMTGRMLEGLEVLIQKERPDWVLVYGDTNSTLAGAIAAVKLHVPVAHVEAGLRSHNPKMPEEINRLLTDRISSLLLCPTEEAVKNLRREGFPFPAIGGLKQRIENIGDVMFDAVLFYREYAKTHVNLDQFGLKDKNFLLCTLHRQENTDDPERLSSILKALRAIARDMPVVLPLHPRTKAKLKMYHSIEALNNLTVLDPVPYLEMQRLLMGAKIVFTDSGGVQKEAYFHKVPCITLRDETEWVETVESGWNELAGADEEKIIAAYGRATEERAYSPDIYGDGASSKRICDLLLAANR